MNSQLSLYLPSFLFWCPPPPSFIKKSSSLWLRLECNSWDSNFFTSMPSLSMGGQMDVTRNHHQTPNNITINQYVTFIEVAFADTREKDSGVRRENMKCRKSINSELFFLFAVNYPFCVLCWSLFDCSGDEKVSIGGRPSVEGGQMYRKFEFFSIHPSVRDGGNVFQNCHGQDIF